MSSEGSPVLVSCSMCQCLVFVWWPTLCQVETNPDRLQEHFEDFYEDILGELQKHGEVDDLKIVENICAYRLSRPL